MKARLLLSCGEPSGDLYAGALTRALRALDPDVSVAGLGGPQLAAAGGHLIDDYRDLAVTGLSEAIVKIPRSLMAMARLMRAVRHDRPDALVLIDFPDFNFPLARRVRALGVPVVYYIGPQVWAWRAGRLKTMRAIADRVLVIFPFEVAFYREGGVAAEFVGHPLVDLATPSAARDVFLPSLGLSATAPTVALLPGSRTNEVERILPDLLAAVARIRARIPDVQCVLARAPGLGDRLFAGASGPALPPMALVEGQTDTVLAATDLALVASGTATVQAALHGTPMVIVYRVSRLTYMARRLLTLDTFGMANLLAGEKIVPELIQDALTPEAVASEAVSLLTDRARVARMREGLARVRERLGEPGASRRAAAAILEVARGGRRS